MPSAKRHPRIDQLLASLGYGSRKDIAHMIKEERVEAEGIDKLKADMRIDPLKILVDGEALDHPLGLLIMLHKPRGFVCSHSENEGPTVYSLLPNHWNFRSPAIESIGRLDKDTSGLILLTDQHDFIHRFTSPKNHVIKIYEAEVENELTPKMVEIFASGKLLLDSDDKACLPAQLEIIDNKKARVSMSEGRFHQVRRMFEAVGTPVIKLHRTQFGALKLGNLPESEFQLLEPEIKSVTGDL